MKNTLVLFAHPYLEHSRSNVELINFYVRHQHYEFRDLYEEFPDFHIPAFRERKRIKQYDRIIFHFPIIWFGIPPLLKLYIDEVLDINWMLEKIENPLENIEAVVLVTTTEKQEDFQADGIYKHRIEEILSGFLLTLELNKIQMTDLVTIYETESLTKKQIIEHKQNFQAILKE